MLAEGEIGAPFDEPWGASINEQGQVIIAEKREHCYIAKVERRSNHLTDKALSQVHHNAVQLLIIAQFGLKTKIT